MKFPKPTATNMVFSPSLIQKLNDIGSSEPYPDRICGGFWVGRVTLWIFLFDYSYRFLCKNLVWKVIVVPL